MDAPLKFLPYFKSTIWGGDRISKFKRMSSNCPSIGESWELSGIDGCESIVAEGVHCGMTLSALTEKYGAQLLGKKVYMKFGAKFPLLLKFIDARQDLSIQVHPDDKLAMERHSSLGKTEMWYVLEASEGAKIRTGLKWSITPDEYSSRVREHSLTDVIGCYDSRPGDVYYLPAGRLHAICAGNFLVEVQESSDITYRVDDYGRRDADGNLRELHTELAKDAIDYSYYDDCRSEATVLTETTKKLVKCDYFNVKLEEVCEERTITNADDSFMALTCLNGEGYISTEIKSVKVKQGETFLIPAKLNTFKVGGSATFLTITVP